MCEERKREGEREMRMRKDSFEALHTTKTKIQTSRLVSDVHSLSFPLFSFKS
jgi:hypothetical protein